MWSESQKWFRRDISWVWIIAFMTEFDAEWQVNMRIICFKTILSDHIDMNAMYDVFSLHMNHWKLTRLYIQQSHN